MSSPAQDARHEQILQGRRAKVIDLEHQVAVKENELQELKKKLEDAKRALEIQEDTDLARD